MKNILHELYFGKLRPFEEDTPQSPEYKQVLKDLEKQEKSLQEKLSKKDKKKLDEWVSLHNHLSSLETTSSFIYGVKFAVAFFLESSTSNIKIA